MKLTSSYDAAKKLLDALGVDPVGVMSFELSWYVDDVVTLTVERLPDRDKVYALAEALKGVAPEVKEDKHEWLSELARQIKWRTIQKESLEAAEEKEEE